MTNSKALARWLKMNKSLLNFQTYIDTKSDKYELSIIDLLFVSNFKGGNASIHEDGERLNQVLPYYSRALRKLASTFGSRELNQLNQSELRTLVKSLNEFCQLTNEASTEIDGFKSSYASALLHSYFPRLVPILDRRLLFAMNIVRDNKSVDSTGQVKEILKYYSTLIERTYQISKTSGKCIRCIDQEFFSQPLPKWLQRKRDHKK